MDLCDISQVSEEQIDEMRIQQERTRVRAALPSPTVRSALYCQNTYCGDEIPEERREAIPGVQLCVACQKLKEKGALR